MRVTLFLLDADVICRVVSICEDSFACSECNKHRILQLRRRVGDEGAVGHDSHGAGFHSYPRRMALLIGCEVAAFPLDAGDHARFSAM